MPSDDTLGQERPTPEMWGGLVEKEALELDLTKREGWGLLPPGAAA